MQGRGLAGERTRAEGPWGRGAEGPVKEKYRRGGLFAKISVYEG